MKFVHYSAEKKIGIVTLNRPEKRNALNNQFVAELDKVFTEINKDKYLNVVIIRAEGEVFCAGADLEYLKQLQKNSFQENLEDSTQLKDLFYKIYTSDKITIAQMHGHAIAGGAGLVTLCDFVFASPEARLGYTEVKIGFIPAIVTLFLKKKTTEGIASRLLLSGELISAETAQQLGLVYKVTEKETIEAEVRAFAENLVKNNSGNSMKLTKQLIQKVDGMSDKEALEYAARLNAKTRESDDCKKGIQAFLNKEEITW